MGYSGITTTESPMQSETTQRRGQGRLLTCGCFGCIGLLVLLCAGTLAFTSWVVEGSRPIPGDPSRFDPVASYADVAALAGPNAELTSLIVQYVRPDGTLDLNASYSPRALYAFYREVPAPSDKPIGAGGTASGMVYEPVRVEVSRPFDLMQVRRASGIAVNTYPYLDLGMDPEYGSAVPNAPGVAVPPPACSLADLWKMALAQDAPSDAVATITYDQYGYQFQIDGVNLRMAFDANCKETS